MSLIKKGAKMDTNELIKYLISPAGQVAFIMAFAEVVKRLELFAPKFIFIVDMVLGAILGIAIFWVYQGMHPILAVIAGIAEGFIASGVFSGVKNLMETYDNPEFVVDEGEEIEEENEQ